MSLRATKWAWSVPGLKTDERFVLLALADKHFDRDGLCKPSKGVATIAEMTGYSHYGASKIIDRLEAKGLVRVIRRPSRTHQFVLTVDGAAPNGVGGDDDEPDPNGVEGTGAGQPPTALRPAPNGVEGCPQPGWGPTTQDCTGSTREAALRAEEAEASKQEAPTPSRPIPAPPSGHGDAPLFGSLPPPSPKAELFGEGVASVARLIAKPTAKAKPLVIAMLKAAGNDHARVLSIIREAEADPPLEPASWLMGCAKRQATKPEPRKPVLTWATMPPAGREAFDAVLEVWCLGDEAFPALPDTVAALMAEGFDGEHMVAAAKQVIHSHPFTNRLDWLPAYFAKRVREVAAERGETPRPRPPSQAPNVIALRSAQGAD